ncbi:E3 ubiquitin/ISG15 ligase TRIM25-like [Bufo gargarizans]|uniref:E3 ubiquitin/ISG15 ligase TRIM25-like n=1 Tax=Bufo gargarizans TaxID=30331 RepID=UPI001CF5C47D|nr:E3 ubiquitin/ISG15 ligase TRIM25-like [Bufo gargarizans]
MASADPTETLTCPNCQNTSEEADAGKCEHNFCWVCIDCVLDKQRGVHTHHECRAEARPVHERRLQAVRGHDSAITCTYCVHSPTPAIKSCVMCEASLCDIHLAVHSKSPEHVLIDPTTALRNRKCSVHKKILEYYCTADAACVCVSCILFGDHRGHRVETFDVVSERKKKKIKNDLEKLISRNTETEKKIQTLQNRGGAVQEKASDLSERVTALFRDIRRQLDALEKRVLCEVSKQEEKVSLSVSKLVQQLELEKDELSRKISYLEEMCTKSDPLTVIQEQESEIEDFSGMAEDAANQLDRQIYSVASVDEGLISVTLHTGLCDIIAGIKKGINVHGATDILLDINTAGNDVHVSGDLKAASWSHIDQNYPEKSERFQYDQILSSRSFSSGRHFWEMETSETGVWFMGMCYPSMDRRGRQSWIGDNNKSWCLRRYDNVQYSVIHDGKWLQLPHSVSCQVLGIYLDYEAGQLSFYELRDPIRLLHTFTTTFMEPLHLAFSVYKAWVRLRG